MPLTITADLLKRGPVGAFNVITLEHAEAIVAAAEATELPVILQISENATRYHGGDFRPLAAACLALAHAADADVAVHLDHLTSLDLVEAAHGAGVGSLMFDAGSRPYAENVELTRQAAAIAHADGVHVEAELGYVGGKPDAPASAHAPGVRTDPQEARAFVQATGVDALAVAVGSSHAMTDRTASLDHDLIARLAAEVPVPLVLHGSSGVPDEELRQAVAAGIRKINVGTALNLALTGAVRDKLAADPNLSDPRKYLGPGRDAMTETVKHLLVMIGGSP